MERLKTKFFAGCKEQFHRGDAETRRKLNSAKNFSTDEDALISCISD